MLVLLVLVDQLKFLFPIGGINFLVKFRIELDGIEINNHNPLCKSTFGYQVRINLIKKTIVRNDRKIPNVISKINYLIHLNK